MKRPKVSTIASTVSAISISMGLARELKTKWDDRTLYTATINEDAYVFNQLMIWLNNEITGRRIRFVSRHAGVNRFYDGSGTTNVKIGGHHFSVKLEKPDFSNIERVESISSSFFSKNLVFTTKTKSGLDSLESLLVSLTEKAKREVEEVQILNTNDYGSWDQYDLPYRNIDSIFLPEGIKESLLEDIETFLADEETYNRIGMPWHRGYMLYGPPGNGKSSIVAALAHSLKMNLYNLPLSGVKNDKALAEFISRVNKNSILLIEDIDIFSKSVSREQSDTGPTLAGLLNALDGVNTPHGLITFITTNRKETLDEALIRPGRIDFKLELTAPVKYQITSMFNHVYGEELGVEPREFQSMAELSNIFKRFTTDPESARLEVKNGLTTHPS